MTMTQHYDAAIIGSGQGGKPLALALARAGWKTALIEEAHVGGTCINTGCTPTKTMVASARAAWLAGRGGDYGFRAGEVSVDLGAVVGRKRDLVTKFRTGSERALEKTEHLKWIRGSAAFAGPRELAVRLNDGGEARVSADRIVVNTGARGRALELPGLDSVEWLDNTSLMELETLPAHLLVVGGGYIGLEFAQMFRRFGSRVTIVQHHDQVLVREDPDIAGAVADILRDDGIELLLETRPVRAEQPAPGEVRLAVNGPDGERTLSGSHLLLATGRAPNTARLNLAAAGLEADARGFLRVNDQLETDVEGVYGMGDVKGGPMFTHISYDDYRILKARFLDGDGAASIAGRMVPYTVFIDPQLGRIGLSEKEARAAGRDYRVAKMPMTHVARALEFDETRGMMKILVDPDSKQILGCAILGMEGGEVASMIQIAMMGRLPYTALRDGIFSHPTLAEALNNIFAGM